MSEANLISERRRAQGLSQRGLAELVGTSQQQIQRIESGVQAARLDLAIKIANALKTSLPELFPKLPKPRISKKDGSSSRSKGKREPQVSENRYLDAGIDTDPRFWTIKVGFHDGREAVYSVSASEKERVASIIWDGSLDFIVFGTNRKRVALNRTKITYCNFLFDFAVVEREPEEERGFAVVRFIDAQKPIEFGIEPDETKPEDDESEFGSQLQNLFSLIELTSVDDDDVLWFDDEDGERVYLRTKQVLSIEIPLLYCEPSLWHSYIEDLEDQEGEGEAQARHQGQCDQKEH